MGKLIILRMTERIIDEQIGAWPTGTLKCIEFLAFQLRSTLFRIGGELFSSYASLRSICLHFSVQFLGKSSFPSSESLFHWHSNQDPNWHTFRRKCCVPVHHYNQFLFVHQFSILGKVHSRLAGCFPYWPSNPELNWLELRQLHFHRVHRQDQFVFPPHSYFLGSGLSRRIENFFHCISRRARHFFHWHSNWGECTFRVLIVTVNLSSCLSLHFRVRLLQVVQVALVIDIRIRIKTDVDSGTCTFLLFIVKVNFSSYLSWISWESFNFSCRLPCMAPSFLQWLFADLAIARYLCTNSDYHAGRFVCNFVFCTGERRKSCFMGDC
jgi:hypothetical protein